MSQPDQPAPKISETRARQGRWGRPVFWVLTFSTLMAAIAVFAAYVLEPRPGPLTPQMTRSAGAPPPSPRWTPPAVPKNT